MGFARDGDIDLTSRDEVFISPECLLRGGQFDERLAGSSDFRRGQGPTLHLAGSTDLRRWRERKECGRLEN